MPFTLSHATPADAARIAEIHFATFSPNGMFRAFFPAPEIRIAMQKPLEGKILEEIESPKMTVLIVRASPVTKALDAAPNGNLFHSDNKAELSGEGKIIAFAKWAHPIAEDDQLIEGTTWKWPEGTDWEVLKGWTRKTEEAQERALGAAPCWHLTFIGTDPAYQSRGAGSLLLKWGMDKCQVEHTPAYIESTIEAAPFYLKNGFTAIETFSIDLTPSEPNGVEKYEEQSFVFNTT